MAENIEKILGEQREEYQRYLGVIKEDFDNKLDIVAEGVSMVNEKLDREVVGLKELIRSEIAVVRAEIKELYSGKADLARVVPWNGG